MSLREYEKKIEQNMEQTDMGYMKRVLTLAENGIGKTNPNPLVGAVIVKEGRIIGEGWHEQYGQAHAEVNAVNNATEDVASATVYVNLEPCCHFGKTPPCTELLIANKVKRVVIGTVDPNPLVGGKGVERLRSAGIEVTTGILEKECRRLNEVFFNYIQKRIPFVVLKAGVSLDGKIATSTGESKWITGEAARREVQHLRNQYSGIMVGVETVIKDNPELTCRLDGGRNPIRIILDSSLRIPISSNVLTEQQENPTIIACTERASPNKIGELKRLGAKVIICRSSNNQIDLMDLMKRLNKWNIDSILLEGGATVNNSAFSQGIVNKLMLYMAPKIIGGEKSKTFVGGLGISSLDQAHPMRIESMERVGDDIKITAYPKEKEAVNCLQES